MEPLGAGLILLALMLNPLSLKGMCISSANLASLNEALTKYSIDLSISMIISTAPDKFLFPGILESLKRKTKESAKTLAGIISKADVLSPPGTTLDELDEVLS